MLEIFATRTYRSPKSTVSPVYLDYGKGNGKEFFGYMLEDQDRGLKQGMPLAQLQAMKVKAETAIPAGRYRVKTTYSNKFKRMMPLVCDVPAYQGIRLHSGNKHTHTEGCPLFGQEYRMVGQDYEITNSHKYSEWLIDRIDEAEKAGEEVWITIV